MGERKEGGNGADLGKMSEKEVEKTIENAVEKVPTKEGVIEVLRNFIEGEYKELRSCEDEHGVYLLEVAIPGENDGETIEYSYARKGSFKESQSTMTTISLVYFDTDGFPEGGKTVADFIDGKWEIKK